MFLGLNEIKYSKLRYSLVVGTLFLIAYVVFFLTGLAFGLAQQNRTAVDKWEADSILLHEDAEGLLNMSQIDQETIDEIEADKLATLLQTSGILRQQNSDQESISVSYFGIEEEEFLMPEVTDGSSFEENNEVVVDETLELEYGIEIGDVLVTSTDEHELTVVGFTENAQFSVSPVIYMTSETFEEISPTPMSEDSIRANAVVINGELEDYPDELEAFSISEFINELPGYNAQVLTFSFMIGSLILIAAIVIGIFIYILTMQKEEIFGVLKAQGISSNYISRSVIFQSFLLSVVGISIGLIGSLLTTLVLPAAVPYQNSPLFLVAISVLMLLVATLAGLFSVRTIVRIDPLEAIS
jgi:putative ABC transport system permease protein